MTTIVTLYNDQSLHDNDNQVASICHVHSRSVPLDFMTLFMTSQYHPPGIYR